MFIDVQFVVTSREELKKPTYCHHFYDVTTIVFARAFFLRTPNFSYVGTSNILFSISVSALDTQLP